MMQQIALPLEPTDPGSLIESASNADALAAMRDWQSWPGLCAILVGPPRSGKTLIAEWFRGAAGGEAIDDAERAGEERLFHAWNRAQAAARPLLLTSRFAPADWGVALPDLTSRLGAAALLKIAAPDDALAVALLEMHAARGGIMVTPEAIAYALKRMGRSHAAIEQLARRLTSEAGAGRPVGVGTMRVILQGPTMTEDSAP